MAVLNAEQHRTYATITVKKKGHKPQGRFPMPDHEHAVMALREINRAKGLTAADKAKIRRRAHEMGAGKSEDNDADDRRMSAMKRYRDHKAG